MSQISKKKYYSHKRDKDLANLRHREKTNQLSDAEQLKLDKRRAYVNEAVKRHRADKKPTVKNQLNALKIKFKRVDEENNQAQKDLLTFYEFMEKNHDFGPGLAWLDSATRFGIPENQPELYKAIRRLLDSKSKLKARETKKKNAEAKKLADEKKEKEKAKKAEKRAKNAAQTVPDSEFEELSDYPAEILENI